MKIENKIVLITGGSRGLGKNSALHLAKAGADVILTYRRQKEEAEAVVREIGEAGRKAFALPLDTGRSENFPAFFEAVKGVLQENWQRQNFDFLVNNAGIDSAATFGEMTEESFDELYRVHLKGVYFLTQKALPLLADGGGIINFATGLTRFAIPGYSGYAAMKGGIEVLTKYLAKELSGRGVRANVVAPGAIETDFTREAFENNPQIKAFIASQTALGRVGTPDDVGGVVAFLCSEEARWINAQRIECSGGIFI